MKRWRVTQSSSFRGYVTHGDFRFKWVAKIAAWMFRGNGINGLETYTTTIKELK